MFSMGVNGKILSHYGITKKGKVSESLGPRPVNLMKFLWVSYKRNVESPGRNS